MWFTVLAGRWQEAVAVIRRVPIEVLRQDKFLARDALKACCEFGAPDLAGDIVGYMGENVTALSVNLAGFVFTPAPEPCESFVKPLRGCESFVRV